ncbi:MAG: large conductance mechanosensitive channel protein MscL [Clostridia bacterium]|nr:large conductance mechanosensitive channel protein MscL [Clostridia bacterium]
MKFKKTRGLIEEFKAFIMRGNVIDMAVGVIVAGAFGKITTSLVNDVFMPFIGWIIGGFDLSKLNIVLSPEVVDEAGNVVPAVTIGIGTLLVTIIDFLIIAAIVFMIVKVFAKAKELSEKARAKEVKEEVAEDPKPTTEELLTQILEEIKKK